MRGDFIVTFASLLSSAALLLLILAHIGQLYTSPVSRSIAMAKVDISNASTSPQTAPLYTNDSSAPLRSQAGLRQFYDFGLYSYCAYVNTAARTCSNSKIATKFLLYDMIAADCITTDLVHIQPARLNTVALSASLGSQSRSAYYLIFLGSICTALALFSGVVRNTMALFLSVFFSILGGVFLLSGAAVWTAVINRAHAITIGVNFQNMVVVPLGPQVSAGSGLYMTWVAYVCLCISIVPYMITCCTYRG